MIDIDRVIVSALCLGTCSTPPAMGQVKHTFNEFIEQRDGGGVVREMANRTTLAQTSKGSGGKQIENN